MSYALGPARQALLNRLSGRARISQYMDATKHVTVRHKAFTGLSSRAVFYSMRLFT